MFGRLRSLLSTKPTPAIDLRSKPDSGVTFAVDAVEPAASALWLTTLRDNVEVRTGSSVIAMPSEDRSALAPEGYFQKREIGGDLSLPNTAPFQPVRDLAAGLIAQGKIPAINQKNRICLHPLIQAVDLAFSHHRPLTLSPDAIWLVIVQGFGHHVNENAESLRDRIVRHEGKMDLKAACISLGAEHLPGLIAQFSRQIRENSDPVLYESLMCSFSTTTPEIHTAFEVALMDVYKRYFNYLAMMVCGIPSITLQGTTEDWQRMRDRIEVLATYDLDWWTSRLAPILDQCIATSQGNPDPVFWKAIYKPERPYGDNAATGWIADLFPYLDNKQGGYVRNRVLNTERTTWELPKSEHEMVSNGVGLKAFPNGLSRAPVTVQPLNGLSKEYDLAAGFFGIGQTPETNALYPIISWALVEKAAEQPALNF